MKILKLIVLFWVFFAVFFMICCSAQNGAADDGEKSFTAPPDKSGEDTAEPITEIPEPD